MMKRKFWIGASFSALVLAAAMAPWSASQANGVSVRVSTPEFGIRIGAPHFPIFQPVPVYQPVPIYRPRVRYVPPPVIYVPPPRWGYGYAGYRGHGHYWEHRGWEQHRNNRHDRHGDR
jgi:hypothetical protein